MAESTRDITYEVLDETAVTRDNGEMAVFKRHLLLDPELRRRFLENPSELLRRLTSYREAYERSFEALRPTLEEVAALVQRIIPELFPDEDPANERFTNFELREDELFFDLVGRMLSPPCAQAHVLARDPASQRAVGHLGVDVGRLIARPSMALDPAHPFVGGCLGHAFVDPDFREQGVFRGLMDHAVDFVRRRVPAFQHLDHVQGVHGDTFLVTLNAHPAQKTYSFLAGREDGFFRRYGFESVGQLPPNHPESGLMLADLEFFEGAFPVRPDGLIR